MIISFIGGLKNFPSHLMHCNIASLKVHEVIFSKHGTKKKKKRNPKKFRIVVHRQRMQNRRKEFFVEFVVDSKRYFAYLLE